MWTPYNMERAVINFYSLHLRNEMLQGKIEIYDGWFLLDSIINWKKKSYMHPVVNSLICDLVSYLLFFIRGVVKRHFSGGKLSFILFTIFHLFCLSTYILRNFLTTVQFSNAVFGYTMLLLKLSTHFFILVIVFLFLEFLFGSFSSLIF